MNQLDGHERASVEQCIADLKRAIYELGITDLTEGKRAEKLSELVTELHEFKAALEH